MCLGIKEVIYCERCGDEYDRGRWALDETGSIRRVFCSSYVAGRGCHGITGAVWRTRDSGLCPACKEVARLLAIQESSSWMHRIWDGRRK